jgi:hypothetical protein
MCLLLYETFFICNLNKLYTTLVAIMTYDFMFQNMNAS